MPNYEKALKVKNYPGDLTLPDLGLKIPPYPFQIKGILYSYFAEKCLIADSTGLGKTITCLGLFQLLEKYGKDDNKWIVVVPPNAIYQWESEFHKYTDFFPAVAQGHPSDRINHYVGRNWQFLLITYQILWRDWQMVADLGIKNWVFDDAHYFKHHNTMTAKVVKHLTKDSKRVVLTTATPIQKNLLDMHSLMEALQLQNVFGSEIGFKNHFCVVRKNKFTLRSGRVVRKEEIIGHKNIVEFQRKIAPYFIKRTFSQVGQELPDLMVRPVWLGLHPQQKEIYDQQRQKLIKAQDEGKIREVRNKGFHSIMQTLAGTRTFGLKEDVSMKLDTVEFFIKEKLVKGEKVIVYSFYKETVKVLQERLEKAGIRGVVTITGDTDAREKEELRREFMENKEIQVLLGTGAIEVAMNLQKARYLIMVDLIMNPQRIVQLVGRMRRLGSEHRQVVLYVLLSKDTVEERLWKHLRIESAISDAVFGEKSDVFPPLSDNELMLLLRK